MPGAAGQITAVCTGHDYSRPGKPRIDWEDPAAREFVLLNGTTIHGSQFLSDERRGMPTT